MPPDTIVDFSLPILAWINADWASVPFGQSFYNKKRGALPVLSTLINSECPWAIVLAI